MSVINNKGFVNEGVTYLQIVERFPSLICREGFSSTITIEDPVITRIGTSNVFLLNYSLVHTITYRPVSCSVLKTIVKKYTITIPLELTTPPSVGTLPTITTTTTLNDAETFTNTCGGCPDGAFNKFSRNVALEFAVAATPGA